MRSLREGDVAARVGVSERGVCTVVRVVALG